jgi:hypothetical protein
MYETVDEGEEGETLKEKMIKTAEELPEETTLQYNQISDYCYYKRAYKPILASVIDSLYSIGDTEKIMESLSSSNFSNAHPLMNPIRNFASN